MKTDTARVPAPLPEDWSEEVQGLMAPFVKVGMDLNIFRTLSRHPLLMRRFLTFGTYILNEATLSARLRELVILRTAHLCDAEYEWGQHVAIGLQSGITLDEIRTLRGAIDDMPLSGAEKAALRATDALHADQHIPDALWAELESHFSEQERMDLVFTVGDYTMVAMALNSFGVQLEEGAYGWEV